MRGAAALLLVLFLVAPSPPLTVEAKRAGGTVEVSVRLLRPLPTALEEALPSGAEVRVTYPLRVRGHRWLWWDRRVWRGEVISTTAFDPLTGRYRCELLLDEVVLDRQETSSPQAARAWLTTPPPVRLALPPSRRALYLRIRAVFSTSTSWLIFPSVDGTDWTEVVVEGVP